MELDVDFNHHSNCFEDDVEMNGPNTSSTSVFPHSIDADDTEMSLDGFSCTSFSQLNLSSSFNFLNPVNSTAKTEKTNENAQVDAPLMKAPESILMSDYSASKMDSGVTNRFKKPGINDENRITTFGDSFRGSTRHVGASNGDNAFQHTGIGPSQGLGYQEQRVVDGEGGYNARRTRLVVWSGWVLRVVVVLGGYLLAGLVSAAEAFFFFCANHSKALLRVALLVFVIQQAIVLQQLGADDWRLQLQEQRTERETRSRECQTQWALNRCDPSTRVPYLEEDCRRFELCMLQDPNEVPRKLDLVLGTAAHALEGFADKLSYRSIGLWAALLLAIKLVGSWEVAPKSFKLPLRDPAITAQAQVARQRVWATRAQSRREIAPHLAAGSFRERRGDGSYLLQCEGCDNHAHSH